MVGSDSAETVTPERARSRDLMRRAGEARDAHRIDEALVLYTAAVEADSNNAAAAHNLGVLLAQTGRPAEGEQYARRAVALAPDEPMAVHALAHALMIQGKFREGWTLYEARAALPGLNTGFPVDFPFPRWRGEALAGKRLAIFPEQGLGDQIQFARFVPNLIAQAGAVTLLTAAPLEKLFRHNFPGADIVVAKGDTEFPDPDYWTTLHELPSVLGVELDTIPTQPYLRPPGTWPTLPPGFRIGLKVKGNPKHSNDRLRSLPQACADRLRAELPGVIVSLEPEESGVRDMADTAAIIGQLDLVVSVDTSVAHLAGAMGKACLLLVPGFAPDWRWMYDREDSPWYPNHRLFRGALDGDWNEALNRLIAHTRRIASRLAAITLTREAIALRDRGDPKAALATAGKAVAAAPDDPDAVHALGGLLTYSGRLHEGEGRLRWLAEHIPDRAETRYVLGLNLLLQGRYREGWPFYQARTELEGQSDGAPKGLVFPRWNGEDLKGKKLILFPEQGYGDQIQLARFLPDLVAQGARVTWLAPPPLARLFRHNFPDVTVLDAAGKVDFPDPDYWATLADLPAMLRISLEEVAATPYLQPLAPPVAAVGEGFRIGYKLKGNPKHGNDAWRSLPDDVTARLLKRLPGTLVSLEPADTGAGDFADTAAIISGLDLVVSVDTAVAHLAGAMGKRCLLLVQGFEPDWRWMFERWDSPWYPQHWLYRGDPAGSWDSVLDRLVADAAMLARTPPAPALLERARMLREAGQPLAALEATAQAVAADPSDAGAAYMRGVFLSNCGQLAEGEALLRGVVERAPALPNPRHALGANLLGQGRYREGWPLYEARTEREGLNDGFPRSFPYPRWQGEDLKGKRIAIFPEQGFGDQIQFARFVPELIRRGASVTLLAVPPLARLFAHSFPEVELVAADGATEFPDPDFWATLADLPVRLDVTLDGLDGAAYLRAPAGVSGGAEDFRIGLVARGSAAYLNDRYRSLPPAVTERLTRDLPGEIIDLSPEKTGARDFADTAAIISGLDLVVSVDTSVAHLAGALGKICFLLLPGFAPDWRWMRDRDDSPWYTRHRLYRSTVDGDWSDAIDRLRGDVLTLATQGRLETAPSPPGAWSKTLEIGRKNIKIAPGSIKAQRQLGQELNKIGDFAEAEALLRAAVAQGGPEVARAHYALAFNLLAQGRYREAWPHYRARADMDDLPIGYPKGINGPRWQGQPLAGKRLVVLAEQGLGDTLQLARFLPRLVAQGATVTLFERPALVRLLRAALPLVTVRDAAELKQMGPQHFWTTTFDMLEWLDIDLGNLLPAHYIAAPALASHDGLRIGLCTSGNPTHMNNQQRSLPPERVERLRQGLPGEIVDLEPARTGAADFAETAEIMAGLDLIVSVDTSVAHLAGAMDKPCLLLVPGFGTDWRWLRGRSDSPWYPRHRLFWSGFDGDWSDAIDRLIIEARRLHAAPA
jgi:ADP-heptose:LPS heptosyltransferase